MRRFFFTLRDEQANIKTGEILGRWLERACAASPSMFQLTRQALPGCWLVRVVGAVMGNAFVASASIRVFIEGERALVICTDEEGMRVVARTRSVEPAVTEFELFPLPSGPSMKVRSEEIVHIDVALNAVRHFFHSGGEMPDWLTYRYISATSLLIP